MQALVWASGIVEARLLRNGRHHPGCAAGDKDVPVFNGARPQGGAVLVMPPGRYQRILRQAQLLGGGRAKRADDRAGICDFRQLAAGDPQIIEDFILPILLFQAH